MATCSACLASGHALPATCAPADEPSSQERHNCCAGSTLGARAISFRQKPVELERRFHIAVAVIRATRQRKLASGRESRRFPSILSPDAEHRSSRLLMPASRQHSISDSQGWAGSLVRPLSRRYLLVLASVAALVLVDQAILQPLLVQLNFYAPVINLAGRQRMLSQKVTKEVLALTVTGDDEIRTTRRKELLGATEQWTTAHRALLDGDRLQGVHSVEASIATVLHGVEPAFEAIRKAASDIATDQSPSVLSGTNPSVAVILSEEPAYLRGMETVVSMLEESARARVAWLRSCGIIVMSTIILLLVGVYFLVLQPAASVIRSQVENLAVSDMRHRQLAEMLREAARLAGIARCRAHQRTSHGECRTRA